MKKINKKIKLLSLLVISALLIFVGKETVFASDNAPESFVAKTHALNPKVLGLTNNISVKKTTTGAYVYCYDVNKQLPNNTTYTNLLIITYITPYNIPFIPNIHVRLLIIKPILNPL